MSDYVLGIDLGTSYTAAAVWRDGRAETVSLGLRSHGIPSVLFLRSDDVFLIGDVAERRGTTEPDRVARDFKRRFGDAAVPMTLGDKQFAPERLTGYLLGWVVDQVVEREGGPPGHVTLTCPATWGDYRRELLTEAAATAQLTSVGLLTEPVAAAVYYASQERPETGALVAVYDLGGGTFDVTVVQKTASGFTILGRPAGSDSLGGSEFDQKVMNHVATVLKVPWRSWDTGDPVVLAGLAAVRSQAVEAKEALSVDTEASVPVILPDLVRDVRITRGEFESAIRLDVYATITLLLQTVEACGVAPSDLTSVLLVGGSSRIPLISRLLTAELGVPIKVDTHPKYAVCLGAAISSSLRLSTPAPEQALPLPEQALPAPEEAPPSPAPVRAVDVAMSDPVEEAPVVDVVPRQVGILAPIDTQVEITPRSTETSPIVIDDDRPLEAEYAGDPRRGRRIAVAVLGCVVALVAAAAVLATVLASGSGAGPGSTGPTTTNSTSSGIIVGPAVHLTAIPVDHAPGETMRGVAAAADGRTIITVGFLAKSGSSGIEPRVWAYDDGRHAFARAWTPTGSSGALNGVASGTGDEPMFVAAGWSAAAGGSAAGLKDREATIWTSTDGRNWESSRVSGVNELLDVATRPAGGFIATGLRWTAQTPDGESIIVTSDTGQAWSIVSTPELNEPLPVTLRRLLPTPGGHVLAVGDALGGALVRSFLWLSPDGQTWRQESSLDPVGDGTAWGLTRLDDGSVLIVGGQTTLAGHSVSKIWTLSGDSLEVRPPPVPGLIYAVDQTPVGVLAVGQRGSDSATIPQAWRVGPT